MLTQAFPTLLHRVEGVKISTIPSNKRPRLAVDGDNFGNSSEGDAINDVEAGNSRVATDETPQVDSNGHTMETTQLTAVYQDIPLAAEASSKRS
jgi:hypothetical protein